MCIGGLPVVTKLIAKMTNLGKSSSGSRKKNGCSRSYRWCITTSLSIAILTFFARSARLLQTSFIRSNRNEKKRLNNINFSTQIEINPGIVQFFNKNFLAWNGIFLTILPDLRR